MKQPQQSQKVSLYIGAPGTGKSYLLNKLSKEKPNPIILAPTWFCSTKINGRTIYNYCGSSFVQFKAKQFNSKYVFIDEVFMFSKKEMERILQCANDDTEFYLFGDPFQIKPPNNDGYFWEVLNGELEIIYLTKFYRSQEDKKLQQILLDYRINKRLQVTNLFQLVDIKQASTLGHTILVGTYEARDMIQKTIDKYYKKQSIYGPDGKQYRHGQILFSISKYGSIQERLKFVRFDNQIMIVQKDDQKLFSIDPIKNQKLSYQIISGDVLLVNIAQGQEFDKIIVDSASFFEFGSLYTAISRIKRLEDLYIIKRDKYDKIFEVDLQNIYCYQEKK